MKAKIAVATVSGKAYYKLVNELKNRGLVILSLKPWDSVPLDIDVVITTEKERSSVKHPKVLTYEDYVDPTTIIDEAVRIIQGKKNYEKVAIGIDPGETFGVAILGDGNVIETFSCSSPEEIVKAIPQALRKIPTSTSVVKVGDAPIYTKELLRQLDDALPENVTIEIVSEAGTSHFTRSAIHRRGIRDMMSATMIAGRKGQLYQRSKAR
jgi:predicted RNase H-like nuclease (RuvC/YqgF family)